jgi:uncharacterized protein (TIRG00374 family)
VNSWKLLLLIILAVLVFVGVAGYGDFRETFANLSRFPIGYLLGALGLAALNYALRYLRWSYYLKVLEIRVPVGLSCLVFLSGLAMSITPGKAGEFLKSYLLRDRASVPVARSAPVVVMERLTDVISVVLLAMIGLASLPFYFMLVAVFALLLCGAALALFASRSGGRIFDLPVLRRWRTDLQDSHEGLRRLAAPKTMVLAVLLGAGAWFSEGMALWLILRGLESGTPIAQALPIYAAATLVGAVSALPGGLIGTEGSMIAMLQQSGVSRLTASSGTLLVRLVTLWFAVAVGLVALLWLHRMRNSQATAPEMETGDTAFQTSC